MKQKFDFLTGLDKIKDRVLFQEFIVEMGISKHTIHIPLKEADMFSISANKECPNTLKRLKDLVSRYHGTVEE